MPCWKYRRGRVELSMSKSNLSSPNSQETDVYSANMIISSSIQFKWFESFSFTPILEKIFFFIIDVITQKIAKMNERQRKFIFGFRCLWNCVRDKNREEQWCSLMKELTRAHNQMTWKCHQFQKKRGSSSFFSKDLQFDDVQILLDLMGWAITRYLDVGEYSYVHLWRLFMVPFLGEQYSPSSFKIKSLFCQLSVCYVRKIQNHCARLFHTKSPSV